MSDKVQKGRPSSYKPEFAAQAERLCELGATDPELAEYFGVALQTIRYWMITKPDFLEAVKKAKTACDNRVERTLYHRAVGYEYMEEVPMKVKGDEGEEVKVIEVRKHVPPDTTAMIFWLKNRRKDQWRDVSRHELTGADGKDLGARRYKDLTDEELDDLQQKMAKVKRIDAPKKGE